MGVSKNRGTPKWMVKIMNNPIKMDDLGGPPPIFGNTQIGFPIQNGLFLNILQARVERGTKPEGMV